MAKMSKTFWYKVMDLMHYGRMHLTSPVRGFTEYTARDWGRCFYRDDPEAESTKRAWERWKVKARTVNLFTTLPGDEHEGPSSVPSSRSLQLNYRVVIETAPTEDALYFALGAPHPAGLEAQARCERERREALLPVVMLGIAAAARVEQQRRKVG